MKIRIIKTTFSILITSSIFMMASCNKKLVENTDVNTSNSIVVNRHEFSAVGMNRVEYNECLPLFEELKGNTKQNGDSWQELSLNQKDFAFEINGDIWFPAPHPYHLGFLYNKPPYKGLYAIGITKDDGVENAYISCGINRDPKTAHIWPVIKDENIRVIYADERRDVDSIHSLVYPLHTSIILLKK